MAGHFFTTIENVITGKPVANATVLVYEAGATIVGDAITSGTLATIFSDDGVTEVDQSDEPITSDSRGFVEFWTNETSVAIEISYDGTAKKAISDVEIVGGTISGDVTALAARVSVVEIVTTDATIAAFKALTGAADKVPYFTGTDTMALADFTSFARTLVDDADAATARATLGITSANVKLTESLVIACSDETTALTAGAGKVTFRMPYAFTLSAVRASLTTAQSSGDTFTVDINEGGSTILSTKLTLDNGERTSTTAATAAVISDAALADDAEITIDIDQIGDGTAKGLKVVLIGART